MIVSSRSFVNYTCICVGVGLAHHSTSLEVQKTVRGNWFSFCTTQMPGTELTLSGLVTSPLPNALTSPLAVLEVNDADGNKRGECT